MPISAKIIADSRNSFGNRITTFVLTYPRIIHAEVLTHRMFSRNAASSRAIPFPKMLEMVETDPFIPIKWIKDHSGMTGYEYFTEADPNFTHLPQRWLRARNEAVAAAKALSIDGVTKQFCNRLLEPFLWYTCLVTATDFENFFALRAEEHAEIHFQALANAMLDGYNESTPRLLKAGEWHIPFGNTFDDDRLKEYMPHIQPDSLNWYFDTLNDIRLKIATARCARVSYNNFEGKDDYDADIKLYDRLSSSGHFSPFEHCARVMDDHEYHMNVRGEMSFTDYELSENVKYMPDEGKGWSGNFKGFIQLRKTLAGENKKDPRVLIK